MDKLLYLRVFACTILVVACSGGGETNGHPKDEMRGPAPPTIRDSAGITIVENVEPQWAPGSGWRVGHRLTSIGEVHGDPSHELYRATTATRQQDGTVAVGVSSSGEIRFFRQDGTFLRTVGSTGGGPGEFRGADALRALRRVAGDTLLAWDIYGQNVSIFDPAGGFVRSFRLEGSAQQHFFAGIFSDRSLLMYVLHPVSTGPQATMPEGVFRVDMSLHRFGVDHRLTHGHDGIPWTDHFQAKWGPRGMMFVDPPFGRITSVNAGGSNTYVATGDSDEISVYDQEGTPLRLIRRVGEPIPVTPEMIEGDRARRMNEERGELEEMRADPRVIRMIEALPYPEVLPPYGRTMLDSEMNLWVEEFRVTEDDPPDWSVFDAEGVWLGRLNLPAGLEVYEIGADYILGRSLDEMDVERIEVYQLLKS